eukprot:SM000007S20792  [mRNA]  locus=s7:214345:216796:+ [translate_table: standard]
MDWCSCLSPPVVAVLAVFVFVYYGVTFGVIRPWLGLDTAAGVFHAAVFSVAAAMALTAYALAVLRDAGAVPAAYLPDFEGGQVPLQEVKRKGGDVRYCQKCGHYKPPRAHHCRICNRCILRMDHHCIWINNCVGHNNYKNFLLLVLYVVLALTHAVGLLVWEVVHKLDGGEEDQQRQLRLTHGGRDRHADMLLKHHEGVRARWLAQKAGQDYRHPYDLGVVPNMLAILGPEASCWLCPLATWHLSNGLSFPTAYD